MSLKASEKGKCGKTFQTKSLTQQGVESWRRRKQMNYFPEQSG